MLRRFYRDNIIREELKRLFKRGAGADRETKCPPRMEKLGAAPRNAQDAAEYRRHRLLGPGAAERLVQPILCDRRPPNDAPMLGRVLTTQEDLWILESMVKVIEKLNEDANDPLAAVIKRIEAWM